MALSRAQINAHRRWNEKAYDQMSIRLPKGEKDMIKSFAEEQNLSLAQYIRIACFEKAGQSVPQAE
jgi:hypothetical protein